MRISIELRECTFKTLPATSLIFAHSLFAFMLCVMWLPKNLGLLFKLNLVLGFWIPHSNASVPKKFLTWEITFTILMVCNLLTLCYSIVTRGHFEHSNIGKAIIVFVTNACILIKSSYLIFGRRRLKKIILQIESFSRSSYLGATKEFSQLCASIKKILTFHLLGYFLIDTSMIFYFSMYVPYVHNLKISLNAQHNQTVSNVEEKDKMLHVDSFSLMHSLLRLISSCMSLAIPIKNFAIDILMYLCHFAVECVLKALRRSYVNNALNFRKIHMSRNTFFDEWVGFHGKLKRFDIYFCLKNPILSVCSRFTTEVSNFFSVQVLFTIAGCIINLCFTVFTAVKVFAHTACKLLYLYILFNR